jgi:hypothetical protein
MRIHIYAYNNNNNNILVSLTTLLQFLYMFVVNMESFLNNFKLKFGNRKLRTHPLVMEELLLTLKTNNSQVYEAFIFVSSVNIKALCVFYVWICSTVKKTVMDARFASNNTCLYKVLWQ